MIHGTALRANFLIKLILMYLGKISVGDNVVKIIARISKTRFSVFLSWEKYQITTPLMAIINVADSAL